jgi:hypothetical protein
MDEKEKDFKLLIKKYEVAIATRNFEIGLLWTRALFFWGLIASAFVGYAALRKDPSDISIIVASFGFVCASVWVLVNKGSKFWQEEWEDEVNEIEKEIPSDMFGKQRGKRYSVSRLTIFLSEYTVFVWLCIIAYEIWRIFIDSPTELCLDWSLLDWKKTAICVFLVLSAMCILCQILSKSGQTFREIFLNATRNKKATLAEKIVIFYKRFSIRRLLKFFKTNTVSKEKS